jgi:hypothetical protein
MQGKLSRGQIRHLHELASMKDKGVLTAEEFNCHKALVLESSTQRTAPQSSRRVAPWLLAAVAALIITGVAIVGTSGGSTAQRLVAPGSAQQQP